MTNPPKKKGTAGETELRRKLSVAGVKVDRTPPTHKWDLERKGKSPINILAIRPDRGDWLVTVSLEDFLDMLFTMEQLVQPPGLRIEVKRYARSFIHRVFKEKFG